VTVSVYVAVSSVQTGKVLQRLVDLPEAMLGHLHSGYWIQLPYLQPTYFLIPCFGWPTLLADAVQLRHIRNMIPILIDDLLGKKKHDTRPYGVTTYSYVQPGAADNRRQSPPQVTRMLKGSLSVSTPTFISHVLPITKRPGLEQQQRGSVLDSSLSATYFLSVWDIEGNPSRDAILSRSMVQVLTPQSSNVFTV
jgi:hypothetical protein